MSLKKYSKQKKIYDPVDEISSIIFAEPNRTFHMRELARESSLSTTSVTKAIRVLSEKNVIKNEKTIVTTNIRADLESKDYFFYKRIHNLDSMKLLTEEIVGIFQNPEAVILFGSYAKGEDIEESDIDILVITSNKPSETLGRIRLFYEKNLKRKINIHSVESLQKSSREFKNAVANGIVLHGYVKVV
jgi:predicted nucleotidyltransferase